jgi:hypothetical protein
MLEQFSKGAWEIAVVRMRAPTVTVSGYRYRDFAVHRAFTSKGPGRAWRVSHLPSGLGFPFDFATRAAAASAAVELDRVRNDWTNLDQEDVRGMRARCIAICQDHAGKWSIGGGPMVLRCRLNGYAPPASI